MIQKFKARVARIAVTVVAVSMLLLSATSSDKRKRAS